MTLPAFSEDEFVFRDLAIDPPLEEFQRVFHKKMRSFQGGSAEAERSEPYRRAFEIGEAKIRRLLRGDEE